MSLLGRKDHRFIALADPCNIRHINHAAIHADAPHYRCLNTPYAHRPTATSQMAIQSIGITDGNGCQHGIPLQDSLTTISDLLACRKPFELHDAGFERCHGAQSSILGIAEAIEADTQAAEVVLRLGEAQHGGRSSRMAQHWLVQCLGYEARHAVEAGNLRPCIGILLGHIGTIQMREDRGHLQLGHRRQLLHEQRQLLLHKAQTMHPRIEFQMDGITLLAAMRHHMGKVRQRVQAVNLRFEAIGHHLLEAVGIGIEHHNRHRDATLTQLHPLIGEGDCQIGHTLVLQELCHLEIARTIRRGLDHRNHAGSLLQVRAEIVQIVAHGIQVDLQDGRMTLLGEGMRQLLETERTTALQQDGRIGQLQAAQTSHAVIGRGIKQALARKFGSMTADVRADTHQQVDTGTGNHLGYTSVEHLIREAALGDIRKNQRATTPHRYRMQVVECQSERLQVEAIRIVDQERTMNTLLHLQAHSHLRPLGKRGRRITHQLQKSFNKLRIATRRLATDQFGRRSLDHRCIHQLPISIACPNQPRQRLIIAVIEDLSGTAGQHQLFERLLFQVCKMFLMRIAQRGEDNHIGANDTL